MSFVENIFDKTNIQALREYFLDGNRKADFTKESYESRIKQAYQKFLDVTQAYDANGENSDLFQTLLSVISEYENVYMEIGLQTGILLIKHSTQIHPKENAYQKMYDFLFHEVSKAILNLMNGNTIDDTIQMLKKAQCKTEEIYINSKS